MTKFQRFAKLIGAQPDDIYVKSFCPTEQQLQAMEERSEWLNRTEAEWFMECVKVSADCPAQLRAGDCYRVMGEVIDARLDTLRFIDWMVDNGVSSDKVINALYDARRSQLECAV